MYSYKKAVSTTFQKSPFDLQCGTGSMYEYENHSPQDRTKAREYCLQVFGCGGWVELTHEQDIIWWLHVCIWDITHLGRTHGHNVAEWDLQTWQTAINTKPLLQAQLKSHVIKFHSTSRKHWNNAFHLTISSIVVCAAASCSLIFSSISAAVSPSVSLISSSAPMRLLCEHRHKKKQKKVDCFTTC